MFIIATVMSRNIVSFTHCMFYFSSIDIIMRINKLMYFSYIGIIISVYGIMLFNNNIMNTIVIRFLDLKLC